MRNVLNVLTKLDNIIAGPDTKRPRKDKRDIRSASTRLPDKKSCYEIQKVSKVHRLKEFTAILNQLLKLRRTRARYRVNVDMNLKVCKLEKARIYMKKTLDINKTISKMKWKLETLKTKLHQNKYSSGMAFVSFKYKSDRDDFISKYQSTLLNTYLFPTDGFMYKGVPVDVYEAPEPTDVLWRNLGYPTPKVVWRRVINYIASFVLIFISYLIVGTLKVRQKQSKQRVYESVELGENRFSRDNVVVDLFTAGVTLTIVVINLILNVTMKFLSGLELHRSRTKFHLSYIQKLVRAQFFNTCGVLVVTHIIVADDIEKIWQQGSLLYDASFLIVWKMLSDAMSSMIKLETFWKMFQRWRLKKNPKQSYLLQYEANHLYTGVEVNAGYIFSRGLQLLYICVFFLPVIPLCGVFLFIGIGLYYFAQKYMFARAYRRPEEIDTEIALDAIYRIGYCPVILYVSERFFPGIEKRYSEILKEFLLILANF